MILVLADQVLNSRTATAETRITYMNFTNKNMNKPEPQLNVNAVSRISEGTVIKGEITTPNDIRLDGEFEGRLVSGGKVIVGESAKVTGDIICVNMDMYGTIQGNVYVRDILSLKEGCQVDGNISIRRLVVELGASFNGNCRMISEAEFAQLTGVEQSAE